MVNTLISVPVLISYLLNLILHSKKRAQNKPHQYSITNFSKLLFHYNYYNNGI